MSSAYRLLCVSHDPAIVIDEDGDRDRATAVARSLRPVPGHPGCDLLVGRYSYPLIEVCCPAQGSRPGHPGSHSEPQWVDAGFLRVAAIAVQRAAGDVQFAHAVRRLSACWSATRLRSLAYELDVTTSG